MEVKMIDMKKIATNPLQPRQEFDREKLQELADSIKEGELLQPIVVRKKGDEFEIVCGERRYKSFQILKEPKILAIIRDIKDDTDALEKSLVENVQRDDLTSVERENAIYMLWDSGRYKTKTELGNRLGYDGRRIAENIEAYEIRKNFPAAGVSTRTITDTAGLPDEPRKKIIKAVEEKKIQADDVREVTRKVKEFPEEEQQIEVIERIIERKEEHQEEEEHELSKDLKIAKGEAEPERFISDDPDEIRSNTLKEQCEYFLKMTPSNIKIIKSEKYQQEAIALLKKTMNHINKLLIALGEIDVVE